ncbi:MAG TPA: methyltransferase domain-containing protein [Candidatus Saccharimonadales bacterium]
MSSEPSNIYEADGNEFTEEKERLSSFDLPTTVSIEVIGALKQGVAVLDVGAGPNTSLFNYVNLQGAVYTALDKNTDFLDRQKGAGAIGIIGDARNIPVDNGAFDITHTRFVISHLGSEKQKSIREILRVTKSKGKAVFLDYDWTTAQGSVVFEKVKEFMINGGFLFDADYGAELENEVKGSLVSGRIDSVRYPATQMTDYSQIIKLREAGTTDLRMQGKEDAALEWNQILDDLQIEADSDNPPGFYFPGIVAVTLSKD